MVLNAIHNDIEIATSQTDQCNVPQLPNDSRNLSVLIQKTVSKLVRERMIQRVIKQHRTSNIDQWNNPRHIYGDAKQGFGYVGSVESSIDVPQHMDDFMDVTTVEMAK